MSFVDHYSSCGKKERSKFTVRTRILTFIFLFLVPPSAICRSVVADIKHLVELIDGCSDQQSSSSSFQDKQLEQKMKVQFTKDLALKKQELAKLVSTSQSLAPRVLKKPSVPVTPLKRISKSLRIRNRPGTAPPGGGSRNNTAAEHKNKKHPSATGSNALGQRRTAWGGRERRG